MEPVRPSFFTGHKDGAIIRVVVNGEAVDVLIADKDRLRMFGAMLLALDDADRASMRDFLELEDARKAAKETPEGPPITLQELTKLTNDSVRDFGTHAMYDKGAHEVMDLDALVKRVEVLSVEDCKKQGKIFGDFSEKHKHGERVIADLACALDNVNEERWDALCADKRFENLY